MRNIAVLGLCIVLRILYFFQDQDFFDDWEDFNGYGSISKESSSSISHHHISRTNSRGKKKKSHHSEDSDYYKVGSRWIRNPWYGWSPMIPESMDCSWEECLVDHRQTCKTCRNSFEDLRLDRRRFPPFDDINYHRWIPDVTMLQRMHIDGHDANGNPWPPPLDDNEMCDLLGENDKTKKLLDAVPIVSAPIPQPWTDEYKNDNNNKVLCMIYTIEKAHPTAIRAMRETWASGCDGFLAFSTKSDPRIPAISLPHLGPEEYDNMWQKVRSMWQFVAQHYREEFDWFYIGGDDLFVFPQNLKQFLATYDSSEPHYLGKRFQPKKDELGFNSGGAGYAVSRPALECLVAHLEDKRCEPRKRTYEEDWMTARCLARACNITFEDTRDFQKRERFHHFNPAFEYSPKRGELKWYKNFTEAVGGIKLGKDCCAPDTISFHYLKNPVLVRYLYHYVHNCNRRIH